MAASADIGSKFFIRLETMMDITEYMDVRFGQTYFIRYCLGVGVIAKILVMKQIDCIYLSEVPKIKTVVSRISSKLVRLSMSLEIIKSGLKLHFFKIRKKILLCEINRPWIVKVALF